MRGRRGWASGQWLAGLQARATHLKTITMSRWARCDTGQNSARLLPFEMSRQPSSMETPMVRVPLSPRCGGAPVAGTAAERGPAAEEAPARTRGC